jgi:hypothetical protein
MTLRVITIVGSFEDFELKLFTKLLGDIERSKPHHTFSMVVTDAEGETLTFSKVEGDEAMKLVVTDVPKPGRPN